MYVHYSSFRAFRPQAVQVPSHISAWPGGQARAFIGRTRVTNGHERARRTIGPHVGRQDIILPEWPLRRHMHLRAKIAGHSFDRLLLDSSKHRINPQISQNREGNRASHEAGPVVTAVSLRSNARHGFPQSHFALEVIGNGIGHSLVAFLAKNLDPANSLHSKAQF